jgi:hypothetical protein
MIMGMIAFAPLVQYLASVFPDMVYDDVIEGAISYLYDVIAFKEEFSSKGMGSGPCGVHGSGPPLFEDCFVDVFSYHAVIGHVPDILLHSTMGADLG